VQWHTLTFPELGPERLYAVLRLRQEVFTVEQDCVYLDIDNRDQGATHMLCMEGETLLAYQRCLPPGAEREESGLGRIVVSPGMRGRRLGRELVQRGIEHNTRRWPGRDILINAQAHLQPFYASLGFVPEGEEYLEDGIPHRRMRYRFRGQV
jgi:ElaA protein